MDNKVLTIFLVFLAAFLILPVAVKAARGEATGNTGGVVQQAAPAPQEYSEYQQPPLLNEANLIGTEWELKSSQYTLKCTLQPSGMLYVTHPMLKTMTGRDYLEGQWRVNGNELVVYANISGRDYTETLRISGMNVYSHQPNGKYNKISRFH